VLISFSCSLGLRVFIVLKNPLTGLRVEIVICFAPTSATVFISFSCSFDSSFIPIIIGSILTVAGIPFSSSFWRAFIRFSGEGALGSMSSAFTGSRVVIVKDTTVGVLRNRSISLVTRSDLVTISSGNPCLARVSMHFRVTW